MKLHIAFFKSAFLYSLLLWLYTILQITVYPRWSVLQLWPVRSNSRKRRRYALVRVIVFLLLSLGVETLKLRSLPDIFVTLLAALVFPTSLASFFLISPWSVIGLEIFAPHAYTAALWSGAYLLLVFTRQFGYLRPALLAFLWSFHELYSNLIYAAANLSLDYRWVGTVATKLWFEYVFFVAVFGFVSLFILRSHLSVRKYWLLPLLLLAFVEIFILHAPNIQDPLRGTVNHSLWPYELVYNMLALLVYLNLFRSKILKTSDANLPAGQAGSSEVSGRKSLTGTRRCDWPPGRVTAPVVVHTSEAHSLLAFRLWVIL